MTMQCAGISNAHPLLSRSLRFHQWQVLACSDSVHHDQSGRNMTDVLVRILTHAGLRPENFAGAGGDSTEHARIQREGLAAWLKEQGLKRWMLLVGCIRHFKQLELKASLMLFVLSTAVPRPVMIWMRVHVRFGTVYTSRKRRPDMKRLYRTSCETSGG
jgi:hypothetical protein